MEGGRKGGRKGKGEKGGGRCTHQDPVVPCLKHHNRSVNRRPVHYRRAQEVTAALMDH